MTIRRNETIGRQRRITGVTLIELMIVVIIVGILTAIAYPSYQKYTTQTRRTDAQTGLTRMANLLERFFTECNRYTTSIVATARGCPPGGGAVPAVGSLGLGATGNQSPDRHYVLSIREGNIQGATCPIDVAASLSCGYTITATPVAGGRQVGDGTFRIDATGLKQWDRNNDADYSDTNEDKWTN